jgi:hypothetical protein
MSFGPSFQGCFWSWTELGENWESIHSFQRDFHFRSSYTVKGKADTGSASFPSVISGVFLAPNHPIREEECKAYQTTFCKQTIARTPNIPIAFIWMAHIGNVTNKMYILKLRFVQCARIVTRRGVITPQCAKNWAKSTTFESFILVALLKLKKCRARCSESQNVRSIGQTECLPGANCVDIRICLAMWFPICASNKRKDRGPTNQMRTFRCSENFTHSLSLPLQKNSFCEAKLGTLFVTSISEHSISALYRSHVQATHVIYQLPRKALLNIYTQRVYLAPTL